MIKKSLIFFAILLFLIALPVLSGESEQLPDGISIYQLDNGMDILMIENPALPMVGINVVVKTGSAYETFASSGMSHMLEHLLFNGTTSRTQKQLYDETDMIGGYNNANTSEYYTNYMMVTPAENIEKGMEIQADMLFNSILPKKKFKKEKGIVLEEISKTLSDPREQKERNNISILFKGHALSLPTLGTYSTIENMTRDEVYSFYKNNYVPNNMVLSVVGNFNSAEMLQKIKKIYGVAPAGNVNRKSDPDLKTGFSSFTENNTQGKTFHRFYSGKETIFEQFYLINTVLLPTHVKVMEIILKEKEKILQSTLKKKFPEIFKALSLKLISTPVRSFLEIEVRLKKQRKYNKISESIKDELINLHFEIKDNVLKKEIAKTRTSFLKNIEKPHMFGIFNAYNFAVYGIESVLSSYSGENFLKAATDLKKINIEINPATIIQHQALKEAEIVKKSPQRAVLFKDETSGKTLIVEKNANSHLLALHFLFKHKSYFESKFGKDSSKILHYCFEKRLQSEDNMEISSSFGLSIKVNDNPYFPMDNIYMNPDFGYIRVEGLNEYYSKIIPFIIKNMKGFVPTKKEFTYAMEKTRRFQMMKMGRGPSAKDKFEKIVNKTVYSPTSFGKSGVSFEKIQQFSKEYFSPGNIIVSIVSPIDTKIIDGLFDGFFTASIIKEPAPLVKSLIIPSEKTVIEENGTGNRTYLFWGFVKNIEKKDIPALKALSLVLSDIITFDIREKRGMAYGISSGVKTITDKSLFYIKMGTRPKNRETLISIFPGFFNVKILNKLTDKTLKKLINKYLGRMMFRRLSSINRAYYLAYSYYFHKDISFDSESLKTLKKVSVADVKRVAKKYLKTENPILITVK